MYPEDSNPPFVLLRNPARDKSEASLRATETRLVSAEECANATVAARERARGTARVARQRLKTAETAYVQGCNTLERLTQEYSETRFEVEMVLARAEAELVDANESCNIAFRIMKTAEDKADASLLVLRQAEMDHESAVQRLARLLSKTEGSSRMGHGSAEHVCCNALGKAPLTPSKPPSALRAEHAAIPAMQNTLLASPSQRSAELASHGIFVDVHASESLVNSLLEVARSKVSVASSSAIGATAARNMSVRLVGFGKSVGCLGHGSDTCFDTPTEARTLLHAVRGGAPMCLAVSDHHGLLVSDSGEVLAWGEDVCGRLGLGGETVVPPLSVTVPRAVVGLQGITVTKVACSMHHTLALSIDGDLYAWGKAAKGLLGVTAETLAALPINSCTDSSPYAPRPIKLEGFNGPLTKYQVRDMACGPTFNVACCAGGLSYSWGSAWAGCLGIGEAARGHTTIVPTPTCIEALRGQKLAQVACGTSHVLALTDTCNVWAWGSAEFGKLGLGDVSRLPTDSDGLIHAPLPMHLEDLHCRRIIQVAAGHTHSLAVTRDGLVFSWGSSQYGKLGHGPVPDVTNEDGALMSAHTSRWWPFCASPMEVNGLRGRPISQVACGEHHSLAATVDGEVMAWGLGRDGRLGIVNDAQPAGTADQSRTSDGLNMQTDIPAAIEQLPWGHVQIATCSSYSLLLYSDVDGVDRAVGAGSQRMVPEVVGHLESMLGSGELADVVLVGEEGLEVQAHAVVLLSVPFLSTVIRELRHKRVDDSEIITVRLPLCEQDAIRSALRFVYSGVFEAPESVQPTLELLQCAATLQLVPLARACARTLETMLSPECVAEVWEASHVHELDRLKTKCLRFVLDNYDRCRPETQPSIREAMRKQPAFFDLIMSALAPGPAAKSNATKFK
mmetsp:Transcript_80705/g.130798  ORF Transcript_80705/g.130798 Transcript_80705/m.130798 type:complete len:902 (-) Transcript_80705:41-2746(-)